MKIITSSKFTSVGYGNDSLKKGEKAKSSISNSIFIHHFPIRNYNHFLLKVKNGGSSYRKNPVKNPNIGWHWKAWYKIYEENGLKEEYEKLALKGRLNNYISRNIVKYSKVPRKVRFNKLIFNIRSVGSLVK